MGDRPKVPVPQAKPKAKSRARLAVAQVIQGETKMEVDGIPMSVRQTGDAKSLEVAAQVEEPNSRKVKLTAQVTFRDP